MPVFRFSRIVAVCTIRALNMATHTHMQVIFLPELEGVIPDKTAYTARVNELTAAIDDEVPPSTFFPPPSLSHFSARSRCTSTRSQICGVDNSNPLPLTWTPFFLICDPPQPLSAPPLLRSISPSAHPLYPRLFVGIRLHRCWPADFFLLISSHHLPLTNIHAHKYAPSGCQGVGDRH